MNKTIFALVFGIFLISTLSSVSALGIFYGKTSANVAAGEDVCFDYGVYNSDSSETRASVEVRGEFEQFLVSAVPTVNVPANTNPQSSVGLSICFNIPKASCADGTRYSGNIVIMQVPPQGVPGSAASVGAAAPLELICGGEASEVLQVDDSRSFRFIFPVIAVILVLAILFLFYKKANKTSPQEEY